MNTPTIASLLTAATVLLPASRAAANGFMEYVTIGDPHNTVDYTGFGRVDYVYQIGRYEVTNGQYIAFLNAVAKTDTHELYDTDMAGTYGGIERRGEPGSYTYWPKDVDVNWLNRPVNYVSFWSACRFANWLHNGRPEGPQDLGTTEDGAYPLNGVTDPPNESVSRRTGARAWIPSLDEWYKAAYYKAGGSDAGYWTYPTQSDQPPTCEPPPGTDDANGSANYWDWHLGYAVGPPYYTTEVGAYTGAWIIGPSDGPYGTFDQAGNLKEWVEETGHPGMGDRCVRGGSFYDTPHSLRSDSGGALRASDEVYGAGFRIAVPDPAALWLLAMGALPVLRRRRSSPRRTPSERPETVERIRRRET